MKTLFDTTKIKTLELNNRFIRSALWMKAAETGGHLNQTLYTTYENLAKGGVGLIITGYANISEDEQPMPGMLGIYDDSFIAEYKKLTDNVHSHGSKIALQIVYGGSQSHHPDASAMNIIAPSSVKNRVTTLMPKEATINDIERIVNQFADAAERAQKAGFDAVQVHAAHGYFLSSFLTPYYNRRTDNYNGSIHDRARIIYDVYTAIRARVGNDFPILFKLNFDDFMDEGEGLVFEDAIEVFRKLDELGVDMLEVSATNESSGKGLMPARTKIIAKEKQSYFKEATEQIAHAVSAPVILMGGNRDTGMIQEILETTTIEYFSLARPLLSEPDLISHWKKDLSYIPKCKSCNQCWKSTPNSCALLESKAN